MSTTSSRLLAPAPARSTPPSRRPTLRSIIWQRVNTLISPIRSSLMTTPAASRTQTVDVTVVGTNDKPIYLERAGGRASHRGPESHPVRRPPRRWRPPVRRCRPAGYSHDFDYGNGLTPRRRRRTDPQRDVPRGFRGPRHPDSTNQLLGEVDWHFALQNNDAGFLHARRDLDVVYHVQVNDGLRRYRHAGRHRHDPRQQSSCHHHQRPESST